MKVINMEKPDKEVDKLTYLYYTLVETVLAFAINASCVKSILKANDSD